MKKIKYSLIFTAALMCATLAACGERRVRTVSYGTDYEAEASDRETTRTTETVKTTEATQATETTAELQTTEAQPAEEITAAQPTQSPTAAPPVPTEPQTTAPVSTEPQTTAPAPTEPQTTAPAPTAPQTPAPEPAAPPASNQDGFKLLEAEGFIGSNQKSYNPYGYDGEKAKKLAKRIENGDLSTKGLFKNTLFVGDSIIVGFSDYRLANSGNVIARVGAMLEPHLGDNMQTIINYNPEVLFLHYGLNEMGEQEHFLESYIRTLRADLKRLKEELPYTKIVVMSMWPVKDEAVKNQPRLSRVPDYNREIRKLCVELGVAYDERSELFAANPGRYHNDGIHCESGMYMLWLVDMLREMGLY